MELKIKTDKLEEFLKTHPNEVFNVGGDRWVLSYIPEKDRVYGTTYHSDPGGLYRGNVPWRRFITGFKEFREAISIQETGWRVDSEGRMQR